MTLYVRDATGNYAVATAEDVLATANRLLAQRYRKGTPVLTSPDRTREFLRMRVGGLDYEAFGVMLLDAQNRLIEVVDLFRGTLTQTSVYPREVVKTALTKNAASVILFHNHPSGTAEPSEADRILTHALRESLALVDVRVLDHFVVGGATLTSFAEKQLL